VADAAGPKSLKQSEKTGILNERMLFFGGLIMTIVAAIDIGTISTRLLVAEIEGTNCTTLAQDLVITRLGEGVNETRRLSNARMDQTMLVLKSYEERALRLGADEILAVGTSAIRDSDNREAFLTRVSSQTKIRLRIIAGEEEAALTFLGTSRGLAMRGPLLVADVGGGSTELIGGDQQGIRHLSSINAGAVRMTESFLHQDPVDPGEYTTMMAAVDGLLDSQSALLNPRLYPVLVGVGGTATTLAAIHLKLEKYDPGVIHGYNMTRQEMSDVVDHLYGLPINQRKQLPGLQPERADLILAGAAILYRILERGGWSAMTTSEADILHGIIWDRYMGQKK
jgi:exopolyphosphatase/guanosine-5'-triphosphate,3'-diphosphate pyrophosphatase